MLPCEPQLGWSALVWMSLVGGNLWGVGLLVAPWVLEHALHTHLCVLGGIACLVVVGLWRRMSSRDVISRPESSDRDGKLGEVIDRCDPARIPGVAIYMDSTSMGLPEALIYNLERERVLHDLTLIVNVHTSDSSQLDYERRYDVEPLREGCYRISLRHRGDQQPDVSALIEELEIDGESLPLEEATFFVGRDQGDVPSQLEFEPWRARPMTLMSRRARRMISRFRLPIDAVTEVGTHINL